MSVTREMIVAGHAVTMKRGGVILSADLLTAIYEAMAARRPRVSYVCEVCNASLVPVCDCEAKDMTFGRCCKADK